MLKFEIKNQKLTRKDKFDPATDSVDYLTATFTFATDDWSDKSKSALFRVGNISYLSLIHNNKCLIPYEVLRAVADTRLQMSRNKMFITVVGIKDTVRITTNELMIELASSGYTSGELPDEPTPDLYAQYVAAVEADNDATKQAIKELAERAEEADENVAEAEDRIRTDYANALKGNVSGEIIRIDSVSPVEHNVKVKVHGKNFFDISKISTTVAGSYAYISEVGENYLIVTTPTNYTGNGYCTIPTVLREICPNLEIGKTYILNAATESNSTNIYFPDIKKSWKFGRAMTITEELLNSPLTFYGLSTIVGMGTGNCRISNIQIEEGETATEYTPYVDPSTVELTRCGKNIMPYPYSETSRTRNGVTFTVSENGTITANGTSTGAYLMLLKAADEGLYLHKGKTYQFSCTPTGGTVDTYYGYITTADGTTHFDYGSGVTIIPTKSGYVSCNIVIKDGTTVSNVVFKPLLEIGETATDFEAYNGSTHTPEADGTVKGVYSVAPTMTLLTDTAGVTIEAEYNVDINTVFDRINTLLETLLNGGE